MTEGDTRVFDLRLLLALRAPGDAANPNGPPWLEVVGRDFTALGGTSVLTFLVVTVVLYLALARKRAEALTLSASALGALALESGLKDGYGRPRPDLVPHAMRVFTASFPSGHATLSAAVFLTVGALLARVQPDRRLKVYVSSVATLLALIVGLSRVYLGVHWPTDVLAGWTLGAAWAAVCWATALWLERVNPRAPP
ncbi:phosphatase PAP2 family protein [Roseomonas sp. E05]|uniref:phosphatase PAP2 family protein n=1 Tax=Roseomonas sp. E05 TaxID=3046310 RepID=UPI0024BB465A|nr:phosphatase PAP2 family protein [Roseomonas sp. E05]MDJ0391020.1 phosphatase PAP2 family protein [Roseomonas sp. E05]